MAASTISATLGIGSLSGPAAALALLVQEQTYSHASYRGIMDIFPPYMCGTISPKDGRADVTMLFPHIRSYGSKKHYCLMSLVIKASEVPFIAMRLFKEHIGTGDGVRRFVLDKGGGLLPVNGF
ncbi:hypothetical protein EDB80DRAFT_730072 [Ilyonectria destructans]|nr:hypothetical protein EDB80DRAFT_730072 [Ilyonectria destructans]